MKARIDNADCAMFRQLMLERVASVISERPFELALSGGTDSTTILNTDGSQTTTVQRKSSNGSLLDQTQAIVSATGFSTTLKRDLNGDGTFDRILTDITALNADGGKTETVTSRNADNSLRSQIITTTSADGRTITSTRDTNGDGNLDQRETITTAANRTAAGSSGT